jgi:hypothetical protein
MIEDKKEERPDISENIRTTKLATPVNDQLRKFTFRALRMMRVIISNFRLYPPASPIINTPISHLFYMLTEYLKEHESFALGEAQGNLLVNGAELDQRAEGRAVVVDFTYSLITQGIKSIAFQRGMTKEELKSLLEVMSQPKTRLQEEGGIIQALKKKNVFHIQVKKDLIPDALGKGDIVIKKISELIEQDESDIKVIIQTLEECGDMMGDLGDPAARDHVIGQIANKLVQYDQAVLQKFFKANLPPKVEELNLKEKVRILLNVKEIENLLAKINKWYEGIRKETSSEEEIMEKINRLKESLGEFLR